MPRARLLLAALLPLGPQAAIGQLTGVQLPSGGLGDQLGSGLGDFSGAGPAEASPQLTAPSLQLPEYDLQGEAAPVHGAENLPPLVGSGAPIPVHVADRFEQGFTSVSEVDELIRKMNLNDVGRGAAATDLTSVQAAAQGVGERAPAGWQQEWQAPAQPVPSWETQSRSAFAPQQPLSFARSADWRAAPPPSPPAEFSQRTPAWQPQALLQSPTTRFSSGRAAPSQIAEDSSSLLHLRGPGLDEAAWRPLREPMRAAMPSSAPPAAESQKSFLMQVNPLSPVAMSRARVQKTIVQVDELLCNPPCATGNGVCARDASGGAHALSAGAPRCFCRSPYTGPTCGTPEELAPATWSGKVALLGTNLVKSLPDPLHRGPWHQVGVLALIAGALAVLLTMCWRSLGCRRQERGPKCLSPADLLAAALRRGDNPAERSPLLRGPPRGLVRAPEAQRAGNGLVEAWVKSQPRSKGSVGRRRPGLDSAPQVFKDESDEEN